MLVINKVAKKAIAGILCAVMLMAGSVAASAADTLTLKIDGKTITSSIAPVIRNDRTLVPLRLISETLGATVSWDGARKQAKVVTAAYEIVFTIDSTTYTVNGASKTLDSPAVLINDSTMVPLRAIGEAIGAKVDYIASTGTVTVDYFTTMTGSIILSGSTTVQPIADAAARNLMNMNSGLNIVVSGGGSGAGIKDTIAGTNHIGMSSRDLTDDELKDCVPVAIANDGIAIIVHPSNKVQSLTKEQATKIFLGEIKNWKDVGGDNAPIMVQTRETGSGTRTTFEELLLNKELVTESATPSTSSALIKQAVAGDKNAIGFDSIGFVDETVKAVSLDGVTPSATTVNNGSYLLGRSLYVLTKGKATGIYAMFIDYLKTKDVQQNIVFKEGYVMLAD